ncbi:unnamed protein product [Parnassius mnemosyne]|uniref:Peptidase S1 domain-containing protein n=1 Tax=Parnassius mnemosyne TaxID=213953 RepID=A0AAV1KQF2_9NEOP
MNNIHCKFAALLIILCLFHKRTLTHGVPFVEIPSTNSTLNFIDVIKENQKYEPINDYCALRIVGGEKAENSLVPYQVVLRKKHYAGMYWSSFCGGSLVTFKIVLTAAHCIYNTNLWYEDTAGKMDSTDGKNIGFVKRQELISESKEIEMIGHLHGDIFNQDKFLINGVEMSVKLVRSRESFNLIVGSNDVKFKVCITDATLIVRRARINPSVLLAHQKVLASTTAKYPITRAEVKVLTIPSGVQGKTLDNIFLGQVPKRCPIRRDRDTRLYIDGQQIPSKALQPSFNNSIFTSAYHTLFSGTGIHFLNEGNGISCEQYGKGYCLLAFALTPDLSANSSTHWNLIKHGSVRIEVRFESSLIQTINCIVYAEFDNIIEIDKNRNVTVDYSS